MKPEFAAEHSNGYELCLKCPVCKEAYTHQGEIEIFNRRTEDSKDGVHLRITNGTVKCGHSMEDNPSARRQGMRIRFYCESCDRDSFCMNITQHKGQTFLNVMSVEATIHPGEPE